MQPSGNGERLTSPRAAKDHLQAASQQHERRWLRHWRRADWLRINAQRLALELVERHRRDRQDAVSNERAAPVETEEDVGEGSTDARDVAERGGNDVQIDKRGWCRRREYFAWRQR